MMFKHSIKVLAVAVMLASLPLAQAAAPAAATKQQRQPTFASAEAAAKALVDAVRAMDAHALVTVVGPGSRSWLFSGDPVSDRDDWKRFLAAYDRQHVIIHGPDGQTRLQVGEHGWTFPAPLVNHGEVWKFDATAGREETLNRRIGANELTSIQTLLAIVDAQREYAANDLDGNGSNDYAQRFMSSEGKRDGLYWPTEARQAASPLGPLLGSAALERVGKQLKTGKPVAYHGYHYRLLKGQGKMAPGGAYSYLLGDRMIGGFAVLAFPAKYGVSGVMSFVVNHEGTVFQKNLGKNTAATAAGMRLYNPDGSWKKVP